MIYMFEPVDKKYRKISQIHEPKLPKRQTKGSAGYDFYSNSPRTHHIEPGSYCTLWTDVKVKLPEGYYLEIVPRSSVAIDKGLILKNTIGTIDNDYYGNEENDGNIAICLYNSGNKSVTIKKGDRIAQGIIKRYYTFENIDVKRTGGFGSTGE